jgi:hypothetical protein
MRTIGSTKSILGEFRITDPGSPFNLAAFVVTELGGPYKKESF